MSPGMMRPAPRRTDIEDAAIARVVARISGEYVLRASQLLIEDFGDVRAGLLVQAINANVVRPAEGRDPWRATGPGGVHADEARRPIRISRLAETAGLPFETARRIVRRLIDAGACIRAEGGVIVPKATLDSPATIRNALVSLAYVRRFLRDLKAIGLVVDERPAPTAQAKVAEEAAIAFSVAPFSNEYILRALRLLADTYGDIRIGLVAQAIVTANTAHLDSRTGEGWRYAGIDQTPPDEVLRPISVYGLAESLGTPYETTRAQVRRLQDAGFCVRVEGGFIVPRAVLETPAALRATLTSVGYVRQFLREVHPLGLA